MQSTRCDIFTEIILSAILSATLKKYENAESIRKDKN